MERALKTVVGSACAYEVFALTTGKVPTLSSVCRHHRAVEIALLGILVAHFHHAREA